MKQILAIFIFTTTIGLLNSLITDASITAIKPLPVDGVSTSYTLTVVANAIDTKTKVSFYKGVAVTNTDPNCEVLPEADATSVLCLVQLDGTDEYKVSAGATAQTFKITPKAKKIASVDTDKANKDTEVSINVKAANTFNTEVFQFSTDYFVKDKTDPAPASCTLATDKKSTVCKVAFTGNGKYHLFVDELYNGNILTVSLRSEFISLSVGMLIAILLF